MPVLLDDELDAAVGRILNERDRIRESRRVRARTKLGMNVGHEQQNDGREYEWPPAAHALS
jgi:hypothetical protein